MILMAVMVMIAMTFKQGIEERQSGEGEDDKTSKAGRYTRISTCHT